MSVAGQWNSGSDASFPEVIDISWRHNLRYDPRLGDEDGTDDERAHDRHASRHVRIETPSWRAPSQATSVEQEKSDRLHKDRKPLSFQWRRLGKTAVDKFPLDLKWIPNNWSWPKLKPVIRCALLGWVSILFMVFSRTEAVLGQATFLILVAALIDPPSDPFVAVLERELFFGLFVTIAWAWSCLGIFLASLARTHTDYNASLTAVLSGQYVEAGPTVILAVFLFFGVAAFLFIKGKRGPGPTLFPAVFGAITIDISMITSVLFPYPYYVVGRAIVLPLIFHAALCIAAAAFIFPSTISAQYAAALSGLLGSLESALIDHRAVLKLTPSGSEFSATVAKITASVNKSEAGLAPAAAVLRLVKHDVVWGRFAPTDLGGLQLFARRLVTRANGLGIFFTLIEPTRERFPITPLPSKPGTPTGSRPITPVASRPGTPLASHPATPVQARADGIAWSTTPVTSRPASPDGERGRGHKRGAHGRRNPSGSSLRLTLSRHINLRLRRHEEDSQNQRLHFSLLHLAHSLAGPHPDSAEAAVAVFESQRYLALEATRLSHPDMPDTTEQFVVLLSESCDELLGACTDVLRHVKTWIARVRSGSFAGRTAIEDIRALHLAELMRMKDNIVDALTRFRKDYRLRVLDPYRSAFDPTHVGSPEGTIEPPPHRYLFHCYMYQYHLIQVACILIEVLDEITKMEEQNKKARLWLPSFPLSKVWQTGRYENTIEAEQDDDEDPDIIPGMETEWDEDLGMASRRHPDALPPSNLFEHIMAWVHTAIFSLGGGNVMFAVKAGLLTVILSIPSFLKSTAHFAYEERFVWGIFMGQLTLARFRGDTTFGLVARFFATFTGAVVGLVLWYISAGRGTGNPYGFAATFGVCFPFVYYARLYWPVPAMTNILLFVNISLVYGFSWQNSHYPLIFHFYGWDLAWRRFTLVVCGVTAAFIFSLLPPSTTLRRYQRAMLSTTVSELGSAYCSIVSFANTRGRHELDKGQIVQALVAIRMKLKRSVVLKTNIIYEFSLRGKWPASRYQRILELQMEIAFHLSHLMSVVEKLEPAWSRAFLRRTRFLDADFQGDVLAVISLISTALRTGNPLPQITPCPLLDRFMVHTHGLNIVRHEADDDYGLPRTMTIDTLENEQYLTFAVGITTAFGIILRLDKLMVATKELVGEQYHIHGIGLSDVNRVYSTDRPAKDA
ncbi:hypothetical protein WOLCODRAFT_141429 [Wolfiporia cocos MD-104 SS10]|uniref:ER transporter 6TM N-terminal domain-containing protein n=1 Tax=Wolfiporia cocos (strain MD-104) TaxID=742152 RepID=A0A2H3IZK4_WOLCO|nr:hypothetical protein WOLCODRAFT_141429 [Wolfiporia cocos MD-104 SS10]